jgi:hypothetical protein
VIRDTAGRRQAKILTGARSSMVWRNENEGWPFGRRTCQYGRQINRVAGPPEPGSRRESGCRGLETGARARATGVRSESGVSANVE